MKAPFKIDPKMDHGPLKKYTPHFPAENTASTPQLQVPKRPAMMLLLGCAQGFLFFICWVAFCDHFVQGKWYHGPCFIYFFGTLSTPKIIFLPQRYLKPFEGNSFWDHVLCIFVWGKMDKTGATNDSQWFLGPWLAIFYLQSISNMAEHGPQNRFLLLPLGHCNFPTQRYRTILHILHVLDSFRYMLIQLVSMVEAMFFL